MRNLEKYDIDEFKILAYMSGKELNVISEAISDEITETFSLMCTVYDLDGVVTN